MTEKKCIRCNQIKKIDNFGSALCKKNLKRYYKSFCRECDSLNQREYYGKNRDEILKKSSIWNKDKRKNDSIYIAKSKERSKRYYLKNKEKIKENVKKYASFHKEEAKQYRIIYDKNHREEKNYKRNKKYANDIYYRLSRNISSAIGRSIRQNKNGRHWETLVGYSLIQLYDHIELLFTSDMTWENHGKWHIDHIIPQVLWKYDKPEDNEFKQCWALANLQPMWAIDNFKKYNKVI